MEENEILGNEEKAEDCANEGIAMELLHDFKEHSERMDEHNKRLINVLKASVISFSAVIVLIVGIFFGGILMFLNQYEFESYSQDGSGYNNINTGEQGDVNNGAEIPESKEEKR